MQAGGARSDDVDRIEVADVERPLRAGAHRLERVLEDAPVGFLNARSGSSLTYDSSLFPPP